MWRVSYEMYDVCFGVCLLCGVCVNDVVCVREGVCVSW